jgi:acyl dehydratase
MTVRRLEERPNLGRLFLRAGLTARGRHGDQLPDTAYEFRDVTVDRQNLASYADVCGFRQSDVLPATYPHLLGFPAAVVLMVDPSFPFALPGLVHINNRIEQQRPLGADEKLTVCVHAENLRDHPRGRQFDMITEVTIDGQPVWNESSTYLRRLPRSAASSTLSPKSAEDPGAGNAPSAIWRVPANIGRRYASVSGDVNPIHLNPLAARLFGFRRAIAHGMWLKARCLAALEGRLPDADAEEVEFKSPLLLPSTVQFTTERTEGGWVFRVGSRSGRLHLLGRTGATSQRD